MIKKLDKYIISTFLGPFLFIFSILFFIFSVQFAFQEISRMVGRGLSFFEIGKLLFYLGTTVIQMVVPLSFLLASIMCFGGFGERYELAAMKSTGISLTRIMLPVFVLTFLVAVGLFFFSNNVLPENHKKAKNLMYNIANSKPALRFVPGQFNTNIPGFTMRIDEISGKNEDELSKVMIHKQSTAYQNQVTIIANKGILRSTPDKQYLKFELYNGFNYESVVEDIPYEKRLNQPNRITEFDTLTMYIDVSELINKALDQESIQDHYRFLKFNDLKFAIDSIKNSQDSTFKLRASNQFRSISQTTPDFDSLVINPEDEEYSEPFVLDELDKDKKLAILNGALTQLNTHQTQEIKNNVESTIWEKKMRARMIIHQQRIISFSVMCLIFFMIGAPLGSIIRKGGLGMPVIISIGIFIIWFIIFTFTESEAKLGRLDPYLAAWLPNLIMLPLGIFLTKKAMEDSELFDIEKYKKFFQKVAKFFGRKRKINEHERYQ